MVVFHSYVNVYQRVAMKLFAFVDVEAKSDGGMGSTWINQCTTVNCQPV